MEVKSCNVTVNKGEGADFEERSGICQEWMTPCMWEGDEWVSDACWDWGRER